MNTQKIKQLVKHLKNLPNKNFNYASWFSNIEEDAEINVTKCAKENKIPNECGTAACVAGHTCLLFWDEAKIGIAKDRSISVIATEILGIDYFTKNDLFLKGMEHATKQDAIRRLEHILEYHTLDDYDWTLEEWYQG